MKYIILVGDGMPDYPLKDLDNKTPLEAAKTPNMDIIASNGIVGMANFVPENFPPASDVANLSIFGYDPKKYYSGRAPLEAASLGVDLKDDEVAFRCNLVTINDGIMDDYSAGHISTEDAKKIILELNSKLSDERVRFYPGMSYRHLCVIKNGPKKAICTPPHDITGKSTKNYLPKGVGSQFLIELMKNATEVLLKSDVNKNLTRRGDKTANSIWLWGQGTKPKMPNYEEMFQITGSVITAVDLIKGIGVYAGLDVINVPGATGYLDTNYIGKAEYALNSLKMKDFVFIHVEAPDETGHNGDIKGKIKAIEDFDKFVVGTILSKIKDFKQYRILLTSDHLTPIPLKTHARGLVPFAIMGTNVSKNGVEKFSENQISKSNFVVQNGFELIPKFFREVF